VTTKSPKVPRGPIPEEYYLKSKLSFDAALNLARFGGRKYNHESLFVHADGSEVRLEDEQIELSVLEVLACTLREDFRIQPLPMGASSPLEEKVKEYLRSQKYENVGKSIRIFSWNPFGQTSSNSIRDADLLQFFEAELEMATRKPLDHRAPRSPIGQSRNLTPSMLKNILSRLETEAKTKDAYINFTLFWNLWDRKMQHSRSGSISPARFLRLWQERNPDGTIYLSPQHGELFLGFTSSQFFPSGWTPVSLPRANQIQELKDVQSPQNNFYALYKKYIRGLKGSLSFVQCASKLTRVEKLYIKPLNFKHQTKMNFQGAWKNLVGDQHTIIDHKEMNKFLLNTYQKPTKGLKWTNFKKYNAKNFRNYLAHLDAIDNEHPTEIRSVPQNELITKQLQHGRAFVPLVVSGDAGKGKTISLSKFALSYISSIETMFERRGLHENATLQLPFFFRARHLANVLKTQRSHAEFVDTFWNSLCMSLPEMVHHISMDEFKELCEQWIDFSQQHNSSAVIILDGLDECGSESEAERVVNFLVPSLMSTSMDELHAPTRPFQSHNDATLVVSTRPSHMAVVRDAFAEFALADMSQDGYHSERELSTLMPIQLCDAWGITREPGRELARVFDRYKQVLIHPLFVGWFCYLILEDKVEEIETQSTNVYIQQNNLISKIIDIGVRSSLRRRGSSLLSETDAFDGGSFEDVLKAFVSVSYHSNLTRPEEVFQRMELLGFTNEIDDSMRQSIMHDCGILYLTGENIEWTHSTVPELIYADFYHGRQDSFNLGRLRVTKPILHRLAQLDFENGLAPSFELALLKLYHRYDREEFEDLSYRIFTEQPLLGLPRPFIPGKNPPLLRLGVSGKPVIVAESSANAQALASMYLEQMGTPGRFALWLDCFEEKTRSELVDYVLKHSENPFGHDLIYSNDLLVNLDTISIDKVNSSTSVAECFRFYRGLLNNEPYYRLDVNHLAFQIHNRAGDYNGIFNIDYITDPLYLDTDNAVRSWIPSVRGDVDSWYAPRSEVIDYITQTYVNLAYGRLFGDWENAKRCIDLLFDELVDYEHTDYFEDYDDTYLLLDRLLYSEHFNDYNLDFFDSNEPIVKAFYLAPFIHHCLVYLDEGSGVIRDVVESENLTADGWLPLEIIREYAGNLVR
jgi:hypothetical protein